MDNGEDSADDNGTGLTVVAAVLALSALLTVARLRRR
jgi:MYXO-CTERM domain-containing protein